MSSIHRVLGSSFTARETSNPSPVGLSVSEVPVIFPQEQQSQNEGSNCQPLCHQIFASLDIFIHDENNPNKQGFSIASLCFFYKLFASSPCLRNWIKTSFKMKCHIWTEELDLVKEDNIFARTVMKGIKLDFVCFAVKYSWKKGTRYSLTYSLKYYFFSKV